MWLNVLIFVIAISVSVLIYFILKSFAILTGLIGIALGGIAAIYLYKDMQVYWLYAAIIGGVIGGILAFPGLLIFEISKD